MEEITSSTLFKVPSESRYFRSDDTDILVNYKNEELSAFKILYNKRIDAHVFAWCSKKGFRHWPVEPGLAVESLISVNSDKCLLSVLPVTQLLSLLKTHKAIASETFKVLNKIVKECGYKQAWYVYMVRSTDNSLYTGITTDLLRRFTEHKSDKEKSAKYFRGRKAQALVWTQCFIDRSSASIVEARIKKFSKSKKENIVLNKIKISDINNE